MLQYEVEQLDGPRQKWKFAKREVRIGRDPACDMVLSSDEYIMVSRHHAVLRLEGDTLIVEDQNTSNGTFVNGNRTPRKELASGDAVRLGADGPEFRITIGGDAAEPEATRLPETHRPETRRPEPPATYVASKELRAESKRAGAAAPAARRAEAQDNSSTEQAMLEQKINALRTLVIVLLVLVVILGGTSIALLQQIDKTQKTLADMRLEAHSSVEQFMPELNARLDKFEKRIDVVQAEMNGVDAKIQAAEDHFVQRMQRELPVIMDRVIEQKIRDLERRAPQQLPRRQP